MPSAGGECPGFTIIPHDNHFHNPEAHAQEVSGDHVTSAVCAPSTTPTLTPPPLPAPPIPPAFRKPGLMLADGAAEPPSF